MNRHSIYDDPADKAERVGDNNSQQTMDDGLGPFAYGQTVTRIVQEVVTHPDNPNATILQLSIKLANNHAIVFRTEAFMIKTGVGIGVISAADEDYVAQ